MMDTPLYVLSTAASMVENADMITSNDKQTSTDMSSSPRERSPRMHCVHRGAASGGEQREYTALKTPSYSATMCSRARKCTGTQTSFSSFGGSPYQRPSTSNQDDESSSRPNSRSSPNNNRCSPPAPRQSNGCSPPPYSGYQHRTVSSMELDMPLNLTVSSASHQNNKVSSGVTMTTRGLEGGVPTPAIGSTAATGSITSSRPIHNASTGDSLSSDPGIEEHFRRSLGTKYPDYMAPKTPDNGDSRKNISTTGNVDDHFAKSLGATWTQLNKPKRDTPSTDSPSGTVDDHFAKALGDTWFKIKAQKEPGSSVSHMESSSSHISSFSTSREFATHPIRL